MIGIYKITSPTNKIYIGQSIDIERRLKRYKNLHCKSQPRLYNSLLKYGFEKHKFEILCECNIDELNDKERYYQDTFSSVGLNGMNCRLTKSSDRSGKVSKETCEKMSISKLGKTFSKETKLKMSESQKGKILSEKTRKKMSESQKGKILSEETRLKLSETMKGKILSEETRLKLSETMKGKILSEETRKKMSESSFHGLNRTGSKHSEESKLKMSVAKLNISEETRLKLSVAKLNISEETRLKLSVAKKKLILNIETGIFYFGAKEAAESINITRIKLYNHLNSKNKTPFIYV